MEMVYLTRTRAGTFYIGRSSDGRFHPIYDGEDYGSYETDWQAAEDLAHNAVGSVCHAATGELLDTSALDIPDDVSEWERISSAS